MVKGKFQILPFVLTGLVLGVLGAEAWQHPTAAEAEPYHSRVRAAAGECPRDFERCRGEDLHDAKTEESLQAAESLLHPNVILTRQYEYQDAELGTIRVHFLLVQCKDSRDMLGHYPPICYTGNGWDLLGSQPCAMADAGRLKDAAAKLTVPAMEYTFSRLSHGDSSRVAVYNFMVLPQGAIVSRMEELLAAAKSPKTRFYGAAQVQLRFGEQVPAKRREAIVGEFIRHYRPLIDAIRSGVQQ